MSNDDTHLLGEVGVTAEQLRGVGYRHAAREHDTAALIAARGDLDTIVLAMCDDTEFARAYVRALHDVVDSLSNEINELRALLHDRTFSR